VLHALINTVSDVCLLLIDALVFETYPAIELQTFVNDLLKDFSHDSRCLLLNTSIQGGYTTPIKTVFRD
jgi:hypothetical protein